MKLIQKLSGLGSLFSKRLGDILTISVCIFIILGLLYLRECVDNTITTVNTVVDNPVINAVNTVTSIFKPKPKPKPTPGTPIVVNDPSEVIIKNKFRVDPHFDFGIYNSIIPGGETYWLPKIGMGITVVSYGESSKVNTYRFLRFGVGGWVNSGIDINFSPVMYNLGHKIPMITNTYLYPNFGYNITHNKIVAGLGLSLSF